jgi:hypothetical protein
MNHFATIATPLRIIPISFKKKYIFLFYNHANGPTSLSSNIKIINDLNRVYCCNILFFIVQLSWLPFKTYY